MKWQKRNNSGPHEINISSKNYSNPKLVINSVMFTDEASYTLVVSNRVGSTTSNIIQLDVTGGIIIVLYVLPYCRLHAIVSMLIFHLQIKMHACIYMYNIFTLYDIYYKANVCQ